MNAHFIRSQNQLNEKGTLVEAQNTFLEATLLSNKAYQILLYTLPLKSDRKSKYNVNLTYFDYVTNRKCKIT